MVRGERSSNGRNCQISSSKKTKLLEKKNQGEDIWILELSSKYSRDLQIALEEIKEESLGLETLIEPEAIVALKAGNALIYSYLVNRILRIKSCISSEILEEIIKGNEIKAVEIAWRKLLLCSWEVQK